MPKAVLKAKKAFSWAHRGVEIEEFAKGQIIETDDGDLIRVSLEEGWTEKTKAPTKDEQKADLEAKIAQLETSLVDAKPDEEVAIEQQLADAKAALAALQ